MSGKREVLKKQRTKADMTQQAVADELGIGLRNYQKIEAGEMLGSIRLWDALEDLFGVNQRELRQKDLGADQS